MSDKIVMLLALSLSAGLFGSVLKEIVWDWLRRGRGTDLDKDVKKHCHNHSECIEKLKTHQNLLNAQSSRLTTISDRIGACEVCIKSITVQHDTFMKLLDGWMESSEELRKDLGEIKVSVAEIKVYIQKEH